MDACVGKILSFLAEPVIRHVWAYVIQYKNEVQLLEQENKRLCEKKERIRGMVETAKNNGKPVEPEVSSWLKDAEGMERDIANFLGQQQNRESFNLMWRHKRGMEADTRKSNVIEHVSKGDRLEKSPVARDAPFQWEPQFDSSQYYTMFGSRALVFANVIESLKDSRVKLIGVHGPGGAGKTTMVKEVAKEAKNLGIFDKIVIAVVSKDPNTSKVQKELAPQLDLKFVEKSDSGRADELRKTLLNGKKILVILDDLWQGLELNTIGIPISGPSHNNCKILLTSRREEVFKVMGVRPYFSIGYLEENEAWELFTKVTGDFRVNESIARKVSERCGGLPIAIVAVGAALRDEEEFEWHNALHKLKNSPLKYIEGIDPMGYTPLKWSYEFLKEEDARSCFLLCCLFPEDAEIDIDDLVRYSFALGFLRKVDTLKDVRNIVQAMVNKLKKSCLLLNGVHENFVKMHDVIRDLAISITEEKQTEQGGGRDWPGQQQFIVDHDIQKWPENDAWKHQTAISLRINDNIHFPCGVLHCPLMHTLVLKPGKSSDEIPFFPGISSHKIPNDFFQGMKGARVLDLEGMLLDLPSLVLELDHLRMLCLNNCKLLGGPAIIQKLKNHIEILSFKGYAIEELPQEIGELTRLRCLDLRTCLWLEVIPKGVIVNLIHLEELYVTKNFNEWDTIVHGGRMSNASIAELKLLTQLTVLHVGISEKSSRIMVQECLDLFKKLINFSIIIGGGNNFSDKTLNVLEFSCIHHIEDGFRHLMDKVGVLRLSNIQDSRYLPQLHNTPSGGRSFSKLINLDIIGCDSIKYLFLPSCARALRQLQRLEVQDCSKMEHIIGVGDYYHEEEVVIDEAIVFNQLTKIHLKGLLQFRSFCAKMEKTTIKGNHSNWITTAKSVFNEKVFFPVLKELIIDGLSVEDIWNKQTIKSPKESNQVSFSQLEEMNIFYCDNLVNVFPSNMLPRFQNLKRLQVLGCSSLTSLVEDLNSNIQSPTVKFKFIDVFPKLEFLRLLNLSKLMKIWLNDEEYCPYDNSAQLYLKTISIICCDSLRNVFSAFVARHLACIEDLKVKKCPRMEVIVSKAKGEGVTDDETCPGTEVIVSEAKGGGVTNDGIIKFCQLKGLELYDLPNLKSFYQFKYEASHLFNHQNCQGFKHVIDLNGTISIGEEQLADGKMLKLYKLPSWCLMWNKNFHEIRDIQSLTHIHIVKCLQLRSLFTYSVATTLQHLEKLSVISCEMMEEIIIIEEKNINFAREEKTTCHIEFPRLKELAFRNLPNLKNICNDESRSFSFPSSCKVKIWNCPKMKTFASGQICLPPGKIKATVEDQEMEIRMRIATT